MKTGSEMALLFYIHFNTKSLLHTMDPHPTLVGGSGKSFPKK
jgi:hypothetical protein